MRRGYAGIAKSAYSAAGPWALPMQERRASSDSQLPEREVVMRCFVLGALIIITSTACGGPSDEPVDMRRPQTGLRPDSSMRSSGDEAAIRKYRASYGEDAVDTCVRVFDNDNGLQEGLPFQKPGHPDLAAFLCSCVGASTCL